jgi:hypothetical protein
MNTARWHEFLVYCLNRPLAYAILELSRRLGDVVRIPRIGYIVNDAEVAREVLTDGAHFDSHSPGSLGVLITQVLGPCALLNMDGPEHKDLKRRLMEVFSPMFDLATEFTALAGLGKRRLGPRELMKAREIVARLAAHIRASYEDVEHRDRSLTQQMRARDFSFDEGGPSGRGFVIPLGGTTEQPPPQPPASGT